MEKKRNREEMEKELGEILKRMPQDSKRSMERASRILNGGVSRVIRPNCDSDIDDDTDSTNL